MEKEQIHVCLFWGPLPHYRKGLAQAGYWDSAPVLLLCFLFCLSEAGRAGEIDCSLYQHSRGCMAESHKVPTVSPSHRELLFSICTVKACRPGFENSYKPRYAVSEWTCCNIAKWHSIWEPAALQQMKRRSPLEKHMFQCATANLG